MSHTSLLKSILIAIAAATLVVAGCGGYTASTPVYTPPTTTQSSPTPTPAPTPAAPTPTPTPTPAPTPAANPDMFQAAMLKPDGHTMGQIQVNASANNGAGMLIVSGGPPNASLDLQFWPFDPDTYGKGGAPAYSVTTVSTDASGNAQMNFQYPKSGVFFGNFRLFQGATDVADSGFNYPSSQSSLTSTPDYHASIQRASTVNDVNWSTFTLGNDQITTGTFNIHGSTLTVNITGAVPSSIYEMTLCPGMTGSGCYGSGRFSTDATGAANATIDLNTTSAGGYTPGDETFYFTRGNALQYVAGFKVQ